MQSDEPLIKFFNETIANEGENLPAGELACLRRAFFESHTFMLAELKNQVERKEEDGPRKVPQPERNARLDSQKKRLLGLSLTGVHEPAHGLVDNVAQQKEDEILRYIHPEDCSSRESELRSGKVGKSNKADISSDLLVKQALTRRSLAYDQLEIFSFGFLESWVDYLFSLMSRVPVQGYAKISLQQILEADRQVFILTSEECRGGITMKIPGTYPAEVAFQSVRAEPILTTLLQHLPAQRSGGGGGESKDVKRQRTADTGSKGSKGGGKNGKGKGKGQKTRTGQVPKALIGLNSRSRDGEPLCYGYNLSGCSAAEPGRKCTKGYHFCAKCLGVHSLNDCKEK
jgi:hypothetical protein